MIINKIVSATTIALIVLSTTLYMQNCFADVESENAILARISHELDALQPLVNMAEKQQPQNIRLRFNYPALRSDLRKIKSGIDQQLNQVAIEPRPVEPVSGDYISVESLKP